MPFAYHIYPAGFPGFGGLVDKTYTGLREDPNGAKRLAIKNVNMTPP